MHLSNGILSGLVAITAGCDIVSPANALIIGLVAGGTYPLCSHIIGPVLHIDDVVDAVAVHLCGGAWGVIAVGLFHHKLGLVATGSIAFLKTQCFGCLVLALTAGVLIFLCSFWINSPASFASPLRLRRKASTANLVSQRMCTTRRSCCASRRRATSSSTMALTLRDLLLSRGPA